MDKFIVRYDITSFGEYDYLAFETLDEALKWMGENISDHPVLFTHTPTKAEVSLLV